MFLWNPFGDILKMCLWLASGFIYYLSLRIFSDLETISTPHHHWKLLFFKIQIVMGKVTAH